MLCDHCHKNEACIFIREHGPQGAKSLKLCPQCAIKPLLKDTPDFMPEIFNQLHKLLTGQNDDQLEKMLAEITKGEAATTISCRTCGRKEEDMKRNFELGCADCAREFQRLIDDKWHREGVVWPPADQLAASEYLANPPASNEINRLAAELCQAVRQENYKRAAELRDQLRDLTKEH